MKLAEMRSIRGSQAQYSLPGKGRREAPSCASAMADLIGDRIERLQWRGSPQGAASCALFAPEAKLSLACGTLAWTCSVNNPATGDRFTLGLKEASLPDGSVRPYEMFLSGDYPESLDALARLLSLDMRLWDAAWIAMKLRKLSDYPEALGDFLAYDPETGKQKHYPSTVAYMASLVAFRYKQLGLIKDNGLPSRAIAPAPAASAQSPHEPPDGSGQNAPNSYSNAKICPECHNRCMIKKDGCDFCSCCGALGSCG